MTTKEQGTVTFIYPESLYKLVELLTVLMTLIPNDTNNKKSNNTLLTGVPVAI
jgi:hypothetical protein